MNTDAHSKTGDQPGQPMPEGLRALWADACSWVGWLVAVFDRATLGATGVNRKHGARISLWLAEIEGAVRRLILTAAVALAPPALRRAVNFIARRKTTRAATTVRAPFRIFRHATGGPPLRKQAPRPWKYREPKPYGHIVFRADPLLSLGDARPQPPAFRRIGARARNPLDRWVRLSRRDPDWRSPKGRDIFFTAPPEHAAPAQARHGGPRRKPDNDPLPQSLWDWRRRHDEWLKLIPAPQLAARLDALERVIANPDAAITRAARRLRHGRATTLKLAHAAAPRSRPPKRAAHLFARIQMPNFHHQCHAHLPAPDTS